MPAHYDQAYTDYQAKRTKIRRLVRRWYMVKACSLVSGRTLDIGCGVGDLLSILPTGSQGLEYNKATVTHCQNRGLSVQWYDGYADDWHLSPVQGTDPFESIIISHVLEHFDDPITVLSGITNAAPLMGVQRILIIVPGRAGFASDPTHRTMIDMHWLSMSLKQMPDWKIAYAKHYPFNLSFIGNLFAHNELQVVLERRDNAQLAKFDTN